MLEDYYPSFMGAKPVSDQQKQRLIAVKAALEIAKAGASSSGSLHALDALNSELAKAADAIQEALKTK